MATIADREVAAYSDSGAATPPAYEVSRTERQAGTFSRLLTLNDRGRSAHTRNLTADRRDGNAAARDEAARLRDAAWDQLTARADALFLAAKKKRLP